MERRIPRVEAFLFSFKARFSSKFSKDVTATFAVRVTVLLLGMASSILTARLLGPEGRGLLAAAFTVTAVGSQFGNFGLHAANTYFVSKDKTLLPALISNSMFAGYAVMGPLAALAMILFLVFPHVAPLKGWLLALSLALIPVALSLLLLQNLLLGIGNVRAFNWIEFTGKMLSLLIVALFFWMRNASVAQLYCAYFLPAVTGIFLAFLGFRQNVFKLPKFSTSLFSQTMNYGLKAYLAALFAFLALRTGPLFVQYLLGPEATGNYAIAGTMADLLYMFPTVLGTLLFPKLASLKDESSRFRLAGKLALLVAISMTVLSVPAGLLARPVTALLFGPEFLQAVPAFLWLLPGIVMLSVSTIFMNLFASLGFPAIAVYSPAAAAVIHALGNLALLPRMGIVGASMASNAACGLMLAASLIYFFAGRRKNFG